MFKKTSECFKRINKQEFTTWYIITAARDQKATYAAVETVKPNNETPKLSKYRKPTG